MITGDRTDPASLVALHLYCPLVVAVYDVMLLLSTVIQFPEFSFSQKYFSNPSPVALHWRFALERLSGTFLGICGSKNTGKPKIKILHIYLLTFMAVNQTTH